MDDFRFPALAPGDALPHSLREPSRAPDLHAAACEAAAVCPASAITIDDDQ